MMYYRKFLETDLDQWESLAKTEFLAEDFCDKEYFIKNRKEIEGWVLADEDGAWIGCCFLHWKPHNYNPEGVHFLELITFPKYRHKGFAKYLYKLMFDASVGFRKSVCINPENIASMRLAKKYGFTFLKKRKTWHVLCCEKDYYPEELKHLDCGVEK